MDPKRWDEVRTGLGTTLRLLRERRKETQSQIAERADLSTKAVGEIERGRSNPRLRSVVCLAHALEIDIGFLFYSLGRRAPLPNVSAERVESVFASANFVREMATYFQMLARADEAMLKKEKTK